MLPSETLITGIASHHDTLPTLRIYLEHPTFVDVPAGDPAPGYDLNYLTASPEWDITPSPFVEAANELREMAGLDTNPTETSKRWRELYSPTTDREEPPI